MFPLKEKELVMYHTRIKKMYWAQQSLSERESERERETTRRENSISKKINSRYIVCAQRALLYKSLKGLTQVLPGLECS